jgi:two-component system OmpR family sensor kinase
MSAIHAPRSLRGRLLATTLVLVVLGLAVAGTATYAFLNSFLVGRVDDQLRAALRTVPGVLVDLDGASGEGAAPGPDEAFVPQTVYAALLDRQGAVVRERPATQYGHEAPAPALPAGLPGSSGTAPQERIFSIGSSPAGLRYRAIAAPIAGGAGTIVVAIPLTDVAETLHRLIAVEILVAATVLLLLTLFALALVRIGLRPLTDMEETAGAIAAGDLSRRVTPAEPGTEVGRLGLALNAMLAQIERAFAEQTATEARLRRFVADASHELRTPLTSIGGYAQLFRHGAAERPEDLAKTMERIEREASRMGILVEDLLLLARMDEGVTLAPTRFDLTSLAASAVEDARVADPDRAVELRAAGPVELEADEDRLQQVVDNLLRNARAHTPPGTRVTVTVAASNGGGGTLEVADDGPGVAPQDRDHVFERFYRADGSRSRGAGAGAGLGLAIAAEIAGAHGGSLELLPSERGAVFRLRVPGVPPPPPVPATDVPAASDGP